MIEVGFGLSITLSSPDGVPPERQDLGSVGDPSVGYRHVVMQAQALRGKENTSA